MPLYEYACSACGKTSEFLVSTTQQQALQCPHCGSGDLKKMLSAHAAYAGKSRNTLPGAGDTGCCGMSPAEASCAGPGSCCGKRPA